VEALRDGVIAGAGLDVVDPEPLPEGHPLWSMPNVIITPHMSGGFPTYREHTGAIFLENLRRYLDGEPLLNVVDKRLGY
jgi:phosphoglycerate dehydrogenase-like enzyme